MNALRPLLKLSVLVLLAIGGGCHSVALSAPPDPDFPFSRSELTASISVEPDSRELSYSMGGTTAGLAHRFEIEVGATLERYAEAYCARAFEAGSELSLEVRILSFSIEEGAGQLVTEFTAERAGQPIFTPRYEVAGPPRSGLPGNRVIDASVGVAAEGSTTAMSESLHRTLHDVLTLTLSTFFQELSAQLQL